MGDDAVATQVLKSKGESNQFLRVSALNFSTQRRGWSAINVRVPAWIYRHVRT